MKNSKKITNAPMIIGVMGSDKGVGVTHFSIMLAGFISSKERRRTAIVELNHSDAFNNMGVMYYGENYNKGLEISTFQLEGVDYYCGMTVEQYARLYHIGYEYIVIDMGHDWKKYYYEFLRCNTRLIVGNCNEWNVLKFEECISAIIDMDSKDNIHFLNSFGNEKLRRQLERKYRVAIQCVPFMKTPFELTRNSFAFFKQFTI